MYGDRKIDLAQYVSQVDSVLRVSFYHVKKFNIVGFDYYQ